MISASVNTDAINRALGLYAQAMKHKTQPYIVNRMLRNVAAHAVRLTGKANRAKIAWTLGQTATNIGRIVEKGKNKGKYVSNKKRRKILKEDSFAERIVRWRRREKHKAQLPDDETKKRALKMLNARVRAGGFIASGWLPAYRDLSRLTRGDKSAPIPKAEARIKGQDKGYAKPAKPWSALTFGEIGNSAQGAAKWPGGTAGLQAAVNHVAADMEAFAIAELAKQGRASGLDVRSR